MKEVKELLGLVDNKVQVLNIEDIKRNNKNIKIITIIGTTKKVKCPICNNYTSNIHDKLKPMNIKYLKMAEQETEIKLIKRRFICHKCNKKITEDLGINKYKSNISNKLEIKIRKDLLNYNLTLTYIAKDNGISDIEVRNILLDAMADYPKYLKSLPEVISFDEFKADTKEGKYAFIINDPIKKRTLDILPNRKKDYIISYLTRVENRNNVKVVISDMYEPYLLVTKAMFTKAIFVVDRFHYVRYVTNALDDIRIRTQKEYGYNSKEYKLLKNKKNVSLLRKYYNEIDWYVYTVRYVNKRKMKRLPIDILNEILKISDELDRGYQLKELFLDIVKHATYENAKEQILLWIDLCNESNIPEFVEASKTINNWLDYIVNSFIDKRYSNGFTEGLNNKIKVIKRVAFGYKDFSFFRLRLLYILNGKISAKTNNKKAKKLKK